MEKYERSVLDVQLFFHWIYSIVAVIMAAYLMYHIHRVENPSFFLYWPVAFLIFTAIVVVLKCSMKKVKVEQPAKKQEEDKSIGKS